MNKTIILTLTSLSSLFLLSTNATTTHASERDHTLAITNSSDIKTDSLNNNHTAVDNKTQDVLVKQPKTNSEKSETKKKDSSDNKPNKDNKTIIKMVSTDTNDANDDDIAHYQKGIPKMFKITFYDPKVLGAVTMPGGLYAGVAADLNVFPKGTRLKITLPDGQILKRVVNDTGTFAYTNHYQLDIAMPNNQIPSYGTAMAKVELLN